MGRLVSRERMLSRGGGACRWVVGKVSIGGLMVGTRRPLSTPCSGLPEHLESALFLSLCRATLKPIDFSQPKSSLADENHSGNRWK